MPTIHLFNPGHETAVLSGSESYTPPRNVQQMQYDLALLPLWYAAPGDYVWVGKDPSTFLASLPKEILPGVIPVYAGNLPTEMVTAMPWGLSPQSLRSFRDLNRKYGLQIKVPEWKDAYTQLTGRQTSAVCLDRMRERLSGWEVPASPVFCRTIDEVETYLPNYPGDCLLKAPFSSSGRGLLWIKDHRLSNKDKEWLNGALQKQGYVSIEEGVEKIQDFAMEFYLHPSGEATYEGLSVFGTAAKGAYAGNLLDKQDRMLDTLLQLTDARLYNQVRDVVLEVLQEVYGSVYTGYLGIDMLVYRNSSGHICTHPCIEINMRYTMGMLAICLHQQYIHPKATGTFYVTYDRNAYQEHKRMQEQYPLVVEDGRIRTGYLSICPVTAETHYRAYILMEESAGTATHSSFLLHRSGDSHLQST